MSDFLTHLVARSLGTLDVVSPRVPSLYEPYRRESGSLGALAYAGVPGFNPHAQLEPTEPHWERGDEQSSSPTSHPKGNSWPQAMHSPPPEQFTAQGSVAGNARSDKTSHLPPSATPSSAVAFDGARPTLSPVTPNSLKDGRAGESGTVDPSNSAPRRPTPVTRAAEGKFGAGQPETPELTMPQPASTSVNSTGPLRSFSPRQPISEDEALHTEQGNDHADEWPTAAPRGTLEGFDLRSKISSHVRAIYPLLPTSHHREIHDADETPPVTRADRRPLPLRSAAATAALPVRNEASVQVSIGKVEVRAVFPEAPARRPPVSRPQPTVSLDDYLNRRHRGKR